MPEMMAMTWEIAMGAKFVVSEVVLAGLVFVFNLLGISSGVSLAFSASFLVLLMYFVFSGIIRRTNITLLVLIVLSGLNVFITGAMTPEVTLSFEYFKKLIFFYTSILFFEIASREKISNNTIVALKRIILGMTIFLIIDYYVLGNRVMLGRYLTLGFSNPNFTAMWLMHLALFLSYFFISSELIVIKAGCVAAIAYIISVIFQTQNRSTLLVLASFAVMMILGIVRKKYSISRVTLIVFVLIPFIFYIFYQTIITSPVISRIFSFAVSVGKGLDSRAIIWNYATQLLLNNGWVIGNYAGLHVNNTTGMLQMHNSNVDILVSYGIIPFVLFLKLHYDIINRINERSKTLTQYTAMCCFLSVLMLGVFEAGIYAGCTGLNFLSGTFLLLASLESEVNIENSLDQEQEYFDEQ